MSLQAHTSSLNYLLFGGVLTMPLPDQALKDWLRSAASQCALGAHRIIIPGSCLPQDALLEAVLQPRSRSLCTSAEEHQSMAGI